MTRDPKYRPYIVPPAQRARNERALYIPLVLTAFFAYLIVATSLYLIAPNIHAIIDYLMSDQL